jgi:periplasmic divalent cation tolerance protein
VNNEVCEVVITGPSAEWLVEFTRALVEARLAACGQTIPAIRSIYRWQDAIEDETEARVALHTRRDLVAAIVAKADSDHPYDVPCVIALPIVDANPAYVEWILDETTSE